MRVPAISVPFRGKEEVMIWILAILAAIIYFCYLFCEGIAYLAIIAVVIVIIILVVLLAIIIQIIKEIIELIKEARSKKGR